MAEQRLIVAIGRIERVLSRLEQAANAGIPTDFCRRRSVADHATKLKKAETQAAISEIDRILVRRRIMADVRLSIAGREYIVTCKDGEEARLQALGAMVDEKAREAGGPLGRPERKPPFVFGIVAGGQVA